MTNDQEMNCTQSQELLQQYLDGDYSGDWTALARHLGACPECRDLHAAGQLLKEGLAGIPRPVLSSSLAGRILARLLAEQRARWTFQRRIQIATALAAGLLLAVVLGYSWWGSRNNEKVPGMDRVVRTGEVPDPLLPIPKRRDSPPGFSLNREVEDARTALATLVVRAADETVSNGRILLPDRVPASPLPDASAWQQTIPPAGTLRDAGHGVSVGLEPVTSSARRAVNLFVREIWVMK